MNRSSSRLAILCIFTAIFGCGGDPAMERLNQLVPENERQVVMPLAGVVELDGAPAPDLMIRLVKEGQQGPDSTSPKAISNQEGKFQFTTYLTGDGVPVGKYAVIVEQLEQVGTAGWSGPDNLKNRFNHVKEPAVTLEVKAGEPQLDFKIDLDTSSRKPKPAPRHAAAGGTGKPVGKMRR